MTRLLQVPTAKGEQRWIGDGAQTGEGVLEWWLRNTKKKGQEGEENILDLWS